MIYLFLRQIYDYLSICHICKADWWQNTRDETPFNMNDI